MLLAVSTGIAGRFIRSVAALERIPHNHLGRITYSSFQIRKLCGKCVAESWNGFSWKGPLEVIWSNSPAQDDFNQVAPTESDWKHSWNDCFFFFTLLFLLFLFWFPSLKENSGKIYKVPEYFVWKLAVRNLVKNNLSLAEKWEETSWVLTSVLLFLFKEISLCLWIQKWL